MPRIACLHTPASNVAVFDEALAATGLTGTDLHHTVRADLLAAAERKGGLTRGIAAETGALLRDLSGATDAVLVTCSTLGPATDAAAPDSPVPILQVDAALAAEAVAAGGRVVVLCAVETTVEPTQHLFEAAARATGAEVDVRVVPEAWAAFKAGDVDRYHALVARAAEATWEEGVTRVALAQASMTGAAARLPAGLRPLTSPAAGLAVAAARTKPRS